MSRIKQDLSLVSLNQLCTLTGKTYRSLKKSLEGVDPASSEAGTLYYSPPEVLPIIYGLTDQADDDEEDGHLRRKLDAVFQKARLDKARADKVELELEVMRGELLARETVEASWGKLLGNFRQRILNLPAKLAPKLCATKEVKEAERILKAECTDALQEMSQYDAGIERSSRSRAESKAR